MSGDHAFGHVFNDFVSLCFGSYVCVCNEKLRFVKGQSKLTLISAEVIAAYILIAMGHVGDRAMPLFPFGLVT